MTLQPVTGHSYGAVTINEGNVQFGDRYVTVYEAGRTDQEQTWLQLLASLRYPEMNARLNDISNAGHKTFEWVFKRIPSTPANASDFVTWLSNSTGVYLVIGKAGSGKSTFMKFLFEHASTKELLRQWAQQSPVMLLFHSFWLVGTKLQHSFRGLLASLIHQILSKRRDLLPVCLGVMLEVKHSLSDWSESGLKKLLFALCNSVLSPLCIFVDGLDEFDRDDDFDKIRELLIELQQLGAVCKVCVSTRPLPYILDCFEGCPSLRLQDLTKRDIESYVARTLQAKARLVPMSNEKDGHLERVKTTICQKADGVFLWVHYVLKNVCSGLRIGDDFEALQRRVSLLPSGVENLYRHMWGLQNVDNIIHEKEASAIFSFGRHFPMPLFQLTVALQPMLSDHYLKNMNVVDESYLQTVCQRMPRWLHDRSAGLIECVEVNEAGDQDLGVQKNIFWGTKGISAYRAARWRRTKVQYIHRTVHDFLFESEDGRLITSNSSSLSVEEVDNRWIKSCLACFIEDIRGFSTDSLYEICFSKAWLSQSERSSINLLDKVGKTLVDQRLLQSRSSCSNWFFEMYNRSPDESYFHTDLLGMMAGNSRICMKYLLSAHSSAWSSYYKGYLAFCVIIHTLHNDLIAEVEITRMIDILRDLKQAGADLVTPHPYNTSLFDVLAIRSPAARIVLEFCITLLRPRYHRINVSSMIKLTSLLSGLDLAGQMVTLFWASVDGPRSDGFGLSPKGLRNCMITFDAGAILNALVGALQDFRVARLEDELSKQTNALCARHLNEQFKGLWPDFVTSTHILDLSPIDATEPGKFAKCTPGESYRVLAQVFYGEKYHGFDGIVVDDSVPQPWPISDLNFGDRCESFRPFLQPLDPCAEIGSHNWREKGCLGGYFQNRTL